MATPIPVRLAMERWTCYQKPMGEWLHDPARLTAHVRHMLDVAGVEKSVFNPSPQETAAVSAVLFLLSPCRDGLHRGLETCLVLNKRSQHVRQPGDLCCPGGSVSPSLDGCVARLLRWPFLPLGRWSLWGRWRRERPHEARWLALCLATALRESFEEMGLNPLRVRLLGPLPPQRLELFARLIYPLAAWVPGPLHYRLNREVQRVVTIPLRHLLDPRHYVRCTVQMEPLHPAPGRTHPAFRLNSGGGDEILWGATYRIVTSFLQAVFGFTPPAPESLPLVSARLGDDYLIGRRRGVFTA